MSGDTREKPTPKNTPPLRGFSEGLEKIGSKDITKADVHSMPRLQVKMLFKSTGSLHGDYYIRLLGKRRRN
jgi:hypothetical protein